MKSPTLVHIDWISVLFPLSLFQVFNPPCTAREIQDFEIGTAKTRSQSTLVTNISPKSFEFSFSFFYPGVFSFSGFLLLSSLFLLTQFSHLIGMKDIVFRVTDSCPQLLQWNLAQKWSPHLCDLFEVLLFITSLNWLTFYLGL